MQNCEELYFIVKYFVSSETPEWLEHKNSHSLYVNLPEIGRSETSYKDQLFIIFSSHDKNIS